jgi:hypothetical protein
VSNTVQPAGQCLSPPSGRFAGQYEKGRLKRVLCIRSPVEQRPADTSNQGPMPPNEDREGALIARVSESG